MGAIVKWLAGIAASIIAGVMIYQLTKEPPRVNPPPRPDTDQTPSAPEVCHVAGAVYDRETNQPLADIEVQYFRHTQDPNEYVHGVRSQLATTGPDGRFSADCSTVEAENFPLRLVVASRNWRTPLQTNEYVRKGERRTDVNIYVSDRVMRRM
jgi:hypothetical protein